MSWYTLLRWRGRNWQSNISIRNIVLYTTERSDKIEVLSWTAVLSQRWPSERRRSPGTPFRWEAPRCVIHLTFEGDRPLNEPHQGVRGKDGRLAKWRRTQTDLCHPMNETPYLFLGVPMLFWFFLICLWTWLVFMLVYRLGAAAKALRLFLESKTSRPLPPPPTQSSLSVEPRSPLEPALR
jgi:hypothetical protein